MGTTDARSAVLDLDVSFALDSDSAWEGTSGKGTTFGRATAVSGKKGNQLPSGTARKDRVERTLLSVAF